MKILTAVLTTSVVLAIGLSLFFFFYAQLLLDYSLESLKMALETSLEAANTPGSRFLRSSLEGMALDEASRPDADWKTVVLLNDASHTIRDPKDQFAAGRAGIFLSEVLKEKTERRSFPLRIADSVWSYLDQRFRPSSKISSTPEGIPSMILDEADKMEIKGRYTDAERYYREFLNRFSDRPEKGFVELTLAHLLIKKQRLKEAVEILTSVKNEYSGMNEEVLATTLLKRVDAIQERFGEVRKLENLIRSRPEKILTEEGGLKLALGYLGTYQIERAVLVLDKLSESQDPRLRTKAFFYRSWIQQWQGELEEFPLNLS